MHADNKPQWKWTCCMGGPALDPVCHSFIHAIFALGDEGWVNLTTHVGRVIIKTLSTIWFSDSQTLNIIIFQQGLCPRYWTEALNTSRPTRWLRMGTPLPSVSPRHHLGDLTPPAIICVAPNPTETLSRQRVLRVGGRGQRVSVNWEHLSQSLKQPMKQQQRRGWSLGEWLSRGRTWCQLKRGIDC